MPCSKLSLIDCCPSDLIDAKPAICGIALLQASPIAVGLCCCASCCSGGSARGSAYNDYDNDCLTGCILGGSIGASLD